MLVEAPVKRRKGSQHQKEEHFGLRPQEALRTDGVASPVAERLSQLREINQLRGLTPRTAKHKALYHKNLQDLCPGQRWIELSPALAPSSINRSMATLEMWCEGRLAGGAGLTFAAAGPMFKLVLLADLAAVPMSAWQNFAGHLTAQVVNAQTFSRQRGDALEQCSAQICAAVTTAWFTVTALSPLHSEAVQAMEGAGFDTAGNFREDPPTTITYPTRTLLDMLELTEHQQSLAKVIWRDWHADLASVKEDRRRILSCLQASGAATFMQYGMRPDSYSETNTILQQAAALAENSALQQEITLQGQRRFMLEICSPESAARLWTAVWPHWPDKADLLRQVVDSLQYQSQIDSGRAKDFSSPECSCKANEALPQLDRPWLNPAAELGTLGLALYGPYGFPSQRALV
ncbi:hypothetical protein WJX84_002504 [Apatococcus fuscideae]|uniref:Uncharacterized protein n=1 Tax=Apatococcus fuscideae TaxID=2026836 RepID=A0AAW1T8F5_9CHLO